METSQLNYLKYNNNNLHFTALTALGLLLNSNKNLTIHVLILPIVHQRFPLYLYSYLKVGV